MSTPASSPAADLGILRRPLAYVHDGETFDGLLVTPVRGDRVPPTVLVFHGWEGRSSSQEDFAHRLAEAGFAAVCVDLYGGGRRGSTTAECEALMAPLVADRALLRRRLLAVAAHAAAIPGVDPARLAAIGFCFGGLCVLDLARAGAPVRAVASFHGVLSPPELDTPTPIESKIAVFHGWEDPFAPPEHVVALAGELTRAGADWQLQAFGQTVHAFMVSFADSPESGIQYHERSARRAWTTLLAFLRETLTTLEPT